MEGGDAGTDISPGDLVVDAYGSDHYFLTETDSRNGSISLTTDDLAAACAVTAPEVLAHPEAGKAIEQALIHELVICLTNDGTDNGAVRSVAGSTAVRRCFERALESREGGLLYLAELCTATGATERTLRNHCQNHFRKWRTPMTLRRRDSTSICSDGGKTKTWALAPPSTCIS